MNVLALDKTGTLTEGKPKLTDVLAIGTISEQELLRITAIAQQGYSHPLARPILQAADDLLLDVPPSQTHRAIIGRGVLAEWNGKEIAIGTLALMAELGVEIATGQR